VSSLPKTVTWRAGRGLNPRPLGSRANALPFSHIGHREKNESRGPIGGTDLHRLCSPQTDASLYCDTMDTGLVHHMVCLFAPQLSPISGYTAG